MACVFWRSIVCQLPHLQLFSHSEDCLFILFLVCFAVQKLLGLIKSHLLIFISITLGVRSKRILLRFMIKNVLYFPLGGFRASSLTFMFLIHFEFVFVYGVMECSDFILLHIAVQFSQQHLLKSLTFLHFILLLSLSKIN